VLTLAVSNDLSYDKTNYKEKWYVKLDAALVAVVNTADDPVTLSDELVVLSDTKF